MEARIQHVLIIDENAIDNMIHTNLLRQYGFTGQLKSLPCSEYAIAYIESILKVGHQVPGIILQNIDFRNSDEFETIHRYLSCRKKLGHIHHVGMSCLDDPRFFKDILALDDKIKILVKPLGLTQFEKLLFSTEKGKVE